VDAFCDCVVDCVEDVEGFVGGCSGGSSHLVDFRPGVIRCGKMVCLRNKMGGAGSIGSCLLDVVQQC